MIDERILIERMKSSLQDKVGRLLQDARSKTGADIKQMHVLAGNVERDEDWSGEIEKLLKERAAS
jgi:hypothetical protein